MIVVRRANTDADREAWIHVRRVVLPNESAPSVEGLREREKPERMFVLAELDGEVAGSGLAGPSDLGDRFFVAPRVLPDFRRSGVGTALLRELGVHARGYSKEASAMVDDDGSRMFAERFGFQEVSRQVEQVKLLGHEPEPPSLPEGIELVTIAERPELLSALHLLAREGYADLATDLPATITLEDWLRDEATLPAGSFVALVDGEPIAYSGLIKHDNPGAAEDGLTVVRRDWRRQGLALALKRRELAWAAANGVREVITWTQTGNEGMRRLNELLGYEYRAISLTMCAPLPLPLDSSRS
jgi:mycothiol synthase